MRYERSVMSFRRYVAIGDSSTEGLEDPDDAGGYRGWADRLAQHIADAQDEPLEYANLAVRGLRMREIRIRQLEQALAMGPDLITVFGGMNDVLAPRIDFDARGGARDRLQRGAPARLHCGHLHHARSGRDQPPRPCGCANGWQR